MKALDKLKKHAKLSVSPYGLVWFRTSETGVSGTTIYAEATQEQVMDLLNISKRTLQSIAILKGDKVMLKKPRIPVNSDADFTASKQPAYKCSCCKKVKRTSQMVHIGTKVINTCKNCADERMEAIKNNVNLNTLYPDDQDEIDDDWEDLDDDLELDYLGSDLGQN